MTAPFSRIRAVATALALATLPALAAGCGSARSAGESPFDEGARAESTVRITISNRNYKDATVWADWRGTRVRLGRVGGNSTETFRTEYRGPTVRLEIDFLVGGGYVSESIGVYPGDHLELVIRADA